jgi:hypothetical protein
MVPHLLLNQANLAKPTRTLSGFGRWRGLFIRRAKNSPDIASQNYHGLSIVALLVRLACSMDQADGGMSNSAEGFDLLGVYSPLIAAIRWRLALM